MTNDLTYRDRGAPVELRVADLLSRMTLDEKAAQLCCMWERKVEFQDEKGEFSSEKARNVLMHGIGQIARISDYRGYDRWDLSPFRTVENSVAIANAVQRFLVEETRLGIPALFHDEIAHGFLAGDATVFPIPPALGSTWDVGLVEEVFSVVAREARRRGTTVALGPTVDLLRDPRFGRSEEFFGEDAYHVSQMGIAAVKGLQGTSRPLAPDKVFVTLKHFVHGSPLGGLNISPSDVGERTLREHYLVPFAKIVAATNPAAIMPSYNEVAGVPSHANAALLQETGRGRLGFAGAYFSDYFGIQNLVDQHRIAHDKSEAAVLAMRAGVTADLPEGSVYRLLPDLVRAGRVAETSVDEAVRRVLALKFEAGLFERPFLDLDHAVEGTGTNESAAVARRAAERAIVLLKNDGVLPLSDGGDLKLAVIGPVAEEALLGGYSGRNAAAVGILEGLRAIAPASVRIEHADGVWITAPDAIGRHRSYSNSQPVSPVENDARIREAVEVAKRSDIVVLCVGDVPAVTREAVAHDLPGDRTSLGLWGQQDELVEAILATGKPVIAVLLNGRPLAVNRLADQVNALIEGWYLGQEGGHAMAAALFGKINPGGKLPVSIARSVGELPAYYNRHPSADVNQYLEGKRAPLYPFGHGLSYTKFAISAPRLESEIIASDAPFWVEADVTNTGSCAGDEVVQLYVRDEVSSVPRPVLELKRFSRVTLGPGQTRTIRFELTPDDLAFRDINMNWVVEPGIFGISVGNSSASLTTVRLTVRQTAEVRND